MGDVGNMFGLPPGPQDAIVRYVRVRNRVLGRDRPNIRDKIKICL